MLAFYLSMIDDDAEEEKDLFTEIYIEYRDKLANYAFGILKDHQLSEDAVQEAYLILANNMKKISNRPCNQIVNYMIIIVRNVCYKIYNKRKMESCVGDVIVDCGEIGDLEINIENKILQEKIFEIIKDLDPKYGDVLMLKYFYNHKTKEIANELGISLNNVKIRLLRAKEKIVKIIAEEGLYDKC